jgi:glucose-6-phosphate dehydrogenase assembly protein OpcA
MSTDINIGAIERAMAKIWREEAAAEGEERAVTRARVLNLLVYSDDDLQGTDFDDTLFAVTEMHPARALVMTIDRDAAEPRLSAAVTAACRVQGNRSKQLSCEQVSFDAAGGAIAELPSAVAQLLAPDVPVYLWWRAGPDLDGYVWSHLVDMADRVIIDSTRARDPRDAMMKLAGRLRENPEWTAVTDFTWQRLTPWRHLFAGFFDTADHRPYLDRIDGLSIEYVPASGQADIPPRAILLASWFAERLGWVLDADASSHDGDNNRFVFHAPGREVVVRFVPVEREGFGGLLKRATLSVSGEPQAEFSLSRESRNSLSAEIRFGGNVHSRRTVTYKVRSEAELLSTELAILGHDKLYEAAVEVAAQIGAVKQE